MNMSHVISEFSFGPYFPDITQPLDYSFEVTDERMSQLSTVTYNGLTPRSTDFMAYQYYLTVVPTTFIAPRSAPLRTHQYSVTHYERVMEHNKGAPGIFFKFDLEPLALSIHQRTTTFIQLLIRYVNMCILADDL
jgi:endoplasmic reticulum-Golgi intermediate compartment protein 2